MSNWRSARAQTQQFIQDQLEEDRNYLFMHIARRSGVYYETLLYQLGPQMLEDIFNRDPDLVNKLRPINYQDPVVKSLQLIANNPVKTLGRYSSMVNDLKSTGQVIGLAGDDNKIYYTLITEN